MADSSIDSVLQSLRAERGCEDPVITEFVKTCVSYKTNVVFCDLATSCPSYENTKADDNDYNVVLLLGSEKDLTQIEKVTAVFPYLQAEVLSKAVQRAPKGAIYVAQTQPDVRVLIGKVNAEASRHNCAARPDIMHKMIQAAMEEVSVSRGLEVYYVGPEEYALCVATVIARASSRSFSAKDGRAQHGYCREMAPVCVHLACPPAWSHSTLQIVATSVQLCQRLTDAPTNLLDSLSFAEIALAWVEKLQKAGHAVAAELLLGEALRAHGYGGLYGTGKGAEYPPALLVLSYQPKAGCSPAERLALVGKGIVYDSGGLSLKPRDGMVGMKRDMAGAAAVFATFVAMVQLEVPRAVYCLLCIAENAIGPKAQRNDDIVTLKSGLTVEINNTDAEGRLVLSDGVYHASALLAEQPAIIVDMATLTGAQGVATGTYHAALYANTEAGEQRLQKAGRTSGDLCFPVVYCPELHNHEYKSKLADYRNSVASRVNAQVSCAAQFIGNNLAKGYEGEWVHVDLASPATYDEGTGFGVALLLQAFVSEKNS